MYVSENHWAFFFLIKNIWLPLQAFSEITFSKNHTWSHYVIRIFFSELSFLF